MTLVTRAVIFVLGFGGAARATDPAHVNCA